MRICAHAYAPNMSVRSDGIKAKFADGPIFYKASEGDSPKTYEAGCDESRSGSDQLLAPPSATTREGAISATGAVSALSTGSLGIDGAPLSPTLPLPFVMPPHHTPGRSWVPNLAITQVRLSKRNIYICSTRTLMHSGCCGS